jgi:hypothetical protein
MNLTNSIENKEEKEALTKEINNINPLENHLFTEYHLV